MLKVIHPNRWFFWAIAIILIAGLLLWLVVEQYSLEQDSLMYQSIYTIKPHPIIGDTSTWKTYRNEKYGFEFKYPADFIAYKEFSGDEMVFAGIEDNEVWVARNSNLLRTSEVSNLGVNIADTNLSLRAWLDQNKKNYTDESDIKSILDVKFAGRDAVELNGSCNLGSVCRLVVVRSSNDLVAIIMNGVGGEFDQILSTFKFLK